MRDKEITADEDKHYQCLEHLYHSAPINQIVPSRLTVGQGRAEIRYQVSSDYWHSANAIHGSMYFKGLDDAAFFASNSVVDDFFVLTARFEVELLDKVSCLDLRAVGGTAGKSGPVPSSSTPRTRSLHGAEGCSS